jgi:adenosylhomocysteinase
MSADRAMTTEQEVGRIHTFFPILQKLGNRWATSRPFHGHTIAMNLHLTTLTLAFVRELSLGGGSFVLSPSNPRTTDAGAVDLLRELGCSVYTGGDGEDRHLQLLDHQPTLVVDGGFELFSALLDRRREAVPKVRAGVEVSRTGIVKLRRRVQELAFPVININDGRLKDQVENRHGVGESIWQAVAATTGMHLAGRRCLVVGYGPVGRGIATYARAAGLSVEVAEADPVRRLFAHYDGYPTPTLEEGISRSAVVVTATGRPGAVSLEALRGARDGLVLVNAGHGGNEIDVEGIRRSAVRSDHVAAQVARYQLEHGRAVTVLGDGHPLNIVTNSGSPEPVLLHFAVLGLTLEWLCRNAPAAGEVLVPEEVENEAAAFALDALRASGG